MKSFVLSVLGFSLLTLPARGDLTLVQKVEGAGPLAEMTMKVKGDKVRVEATPEVTSIVNGKTGEMLNIMHAQKMVMRVSAEQAKAVAAMTGSAMTGQDPKTADKVKITPTGKKETISGHETEEYIADAPTFKASYWVAKNYPQGDAIMKQLQSMTPEAWKAGGLGMPDFRDFPGLPLRTNVSMNGQQYVSTITSVKLDPLNDSDFAVPQGYQEMQMPDVNSLMGGQPGATPAASPKK